MNRFRQENPHAKPEQSGRPRPLREFRHDSEKKDRSGRKSRSRLGAYYLLPLVALLLILAAGAYLFSGMSVPDEEEQGADDDTGQRSYASNSSITEASELLEAHVNALGGRQALETVRSVRYEGQVRFSSGVSDFQMLLLQPDKGMLVTNPEEPGGQKIMLNGDIAWLVNEQLDGSREVVPLDDENTGPLKWSMRVHNTFRRLALDSQYAGLSVKEAEFMDEPCYEVTKSTPDGSGFLAVLDKETLYLRKVEETLDGSDEKFTIVYDDHRMVSGVVEPYKTTLYKNGDLDNEVEVRSIQINSGVISSLFKVPDELLDES